MSRRVIISASLFLSLFAIFSALVALPISDAVTTQCQSVVTTGVSDVVTQIRDSTGSGVAYNLVGVQAVDRIDGTQHTQHMYTMLLINTSKSYSYTPPAGACDVKSSTPSETIYWDGISNESTTAHQQLDYVFQTVNITATPEGTNDNYISVQQGIDPSSAATQFPPSTYSGTGTKVNVMDESQHISIYTRILNSTGYNTAGNTITYRITDTQTYVISGTLYIDFIVNATSPASEPVLQGTVTINGTANFSSPPKVVNWFMATVENATRLSHSVGKNQIFFTYGATSQLSGTDLNVVQWIDGTKQFMTGVGQ